MRHTHDINGTNESHWRASLSRFVRNRLQEAKWASVFILLVAGSQVHGIAVHELQIASHLGERLNAIVTVEAAPGERLSNACFSVTSAAAGGLPGINDVSIAVSRLGDQAILRLTSRNIVVEPLSEVVIHINCPDLPRISRSYMIMLDPAPLAAESRPAFDAPQPTDGIATNSDNAPFNLAIDGRFTAPARTRGELIAAGTRYRVQSGDTLSELASRIADRPEYSVWRISRSIYANNPDAFLGGSPDRLISGVDIDIPPLSSALSGQREAPWSPTVRTVDSGNAEPVYIVDDQPVYTADAEPAFDASALTLPVDIAADNATTTTSAVTAAATQALGQPILVGKLALAGSLSTLSITRVRMRNAGLASSRPVEAIRPAVQNPSPAPVPGAPESPAVAVPDPKAVATTGRSASRWMPWALLAVLGLLLIAAPFAWRFFSERLREAQLRAVREILRRREHRTILAGAGVGAGMKTSDPNIDFQATAGWAPAALNPDAVDTGGTGAPATLIPGSHRPEETYIVEETMESGVYRRLAEQFPGAEHAESAAQQEAATQSESGAPSSTEKVPSLDESVDFDLGDPARASSSAAHIERNAEDTRSLPVDEALLEASYDQDTGTHSAYQWEQAEDDATVEDDLINGDLELADVDTSELPDDPAHYYHLDEDARPAADSQDESAVSSETLSLEKPDAPADIADTAKIVMFRRHAQKPKDTAADNSDEPDDSDDVAGNNS